MAQRRRTAVLPMLVVVTATAVAAGLARAAPPSDAFTAPSIPVTVLQVFDGDSVAVAIDGAPTTVRLLGVDTPETPRGDQAGEPYCREATLLTRRLLAAASEVRLEVAGDREDKYGRTLGFLWLCRDGQGAPVNLSEALLAAGLAKAIRHFHYPGKESFLELEQRARRAGAGMWRRE